MISRRAFAITAAVVGVAAVFPLPHTAIAADTITTAGVRETETEAGDIVADAVRETAAADIALIPADAFRADASVPRPATAVQAQGLLGVPSDQLVVLTLRGTQVLTALERAVSFAPQPFSGFLQVSGLKFSYNAAKPGGERITTATVAGAPLEAAKTYKVATTRPLANGQLGYFQIWAWDKTSGVTDKSLSDALTERVAKTAKPLSASIEMRITRTDK